MLISEERCIDLFGKEIADEIISCESVNCWYSLYIHIIPKSITGTNDKYYIGMTEHLPKKRWGYNGRRYINHPFYEAIQQFGWDNIEHIVISCSLSEYDASVIEEHCIEYTKSYLKEYGYNARIGSGGDVSHMITVHQFDVDGNYIKSFRSVPDAAKKLGIPRNSIYAAVKNGWKAGGFRWSYEKEYKFDYSRQRHNQPVYQFSLSGELIKKYDSVRSAFDENEFEKIEPIFACSSGASTQAYNYVWVYEKDLGNFEFPTRFFGGRMPVIRYTEDGEYVDEFSCKSEAERRTGLSVWKINKSINDPMYSCDGYMWRLKNMAG